MAFGDKDLVNVTFDSMRQSARTAAYPNTEVETKTVTELEQRIGDKVRLHEADLVAIAMDVHTAGDRVLAQTDELLAEMSTLLNEVERSGAQPSTALAARYQAARNSMTARINELTLIEREAEFHAAKVLDAYGSLQKLRSKYPQIVMGRAV